MTTKRKKEKDVVLDPERAARAVAPQPGRGGVRISTPVPFTETEMRLLVLRGALAEICGGTPEERTEEEDRARQVLLHLLDAYEEISGYTEEDPDWIRSPIDALAAFRSAYWKASVSGPTPEALPSRIGNVFRWPKWLLAACGKAAGVAYSAAHPPLQPRVTGEEGYYGF